MVSARLYVSRYVLDMIFFFQAEDGIRDGTVTGVQTCALPISRSADADRVVRPGREQQDGGHRLGIRGIGTAQRSEERRVGKECRARWAAHDVEKKRMRLLEGRCRR